MLFSLLKPYLELYITDSTLKVFRSLHCFTTSISHGVEKLFPQVRASLHDAVFCNMQLESIYRWRLSTIKATIRSRISTVWSTLIQMVLFQ